MPDGGILLAGIALVLAAVVAAYVAGRRSSRSDVALAEDAASDCAVELERQRVQFAADIEAERESHRETRRNFDWHIEQAAASLEYRESLARASAGSLDDLRRWVRMHAAPEAPGTDEGEQAASDEPTEAGDGSADR